MRAGFVIVLTMVCFLLPAPWVKAHSIHVFASVENGIVAGEGYLSGGKKVVNGEIQVLDKETGELLLATQTDGQGLFSFTIAELGLDRAVTLLIVLNGGPGHRSQWDIPAEKYATAGTAVGETPAVHASPSREKPPADHPPLKNIIAGLACILGIGAAITLIKSRNRGSS